MNTHQDRLYAFRDFTSHLFRLTMTSMKGNQADIQAQFDKVLDKSLEMLETSKPLNSTGFTETFHTQNNTNANVVVEKANATTMPPRLNIRELGESTLFEPSPSRVYSDMKSMGAPPWAHYLSRSDNSRIDSVEPDVEIGMDEYDVPDAGEGAEGAEDAFEEEEVEEEEVEEEEVEEEEVEEEAVEEEGEDEEGMEVITVARKKYYCGERTRQVYKYLNDEEAGELLGTLVNGKINPM